jgi:hypothetical protein
VSRARLARATLHSLLRLAEGLCDVLVPRAFLASAARIAAVFTAASVPLSLFDMAQHVAHYASRSQRYYLRVLLLPLDALTTALSVAGASLGDGALW